MLRGLEFLQITGEVMRSWEATFVEDSSEKGEKGVHGGLLAVVINTPPR
jgi:hypothetical protein